MKPLITDLNNSPWFARLQHKMDRKTKPLGALGRLEALAIQIGVVFETDTPMLLNPQLFVFAGDHGLARHGVSAYPSDVTWQMVLNFIQGGAAVSVLAKQHHMDLHVVDCGVNHAFDSASGVLDYKIANGTTDCLTGPAMSAFQCQQALKNGQDLIQKQPGNVILLGEMGIGNTSSASLIMSRLAHSPIETCTGAGTGLTADAVKRKQGILAKALAANPEAQAPLDVLAAFGGFEIATMVGAVLAASAENRVIVVDGFIASAAVQVAAHMAPAVLQRCVFAHCSGEKGHARMLEHLGVQPLLNLDLRLGEGSGAALAWPLLVSACAILREMASFESAGVSQQTTPSAHP